MATTSSLDPILFKFWPNYYQKNRQLSQKDAIRIYDYSHSDQYIRYKINRNFFKYFKDLPKYSE